MPRTIHLMNSTGHVSIAWEAHNDTEVLPVIEQMLQSGYRFFIVDDFGRRADVTTTNQAVARRKVILADNSLQQLYEDGMLFLSAGDDEEEGEPSGELATTAEQVAENTTVATKPVQGG